MSKPAHTKQWVLLISTLFIGLILFLRAGVLIRGFSDNVGFIKLNVALSVADEGQETNEAREAESHFLRGARAGFPIGPFTTRGLGLALGVQDGVEQAQLTLDTLGAQAAVNYTLLGDLANKLHRLDRAQYWYEQAVTADPGHLQAWMKLGAVHEQRGALAKATGVYEKVWAESPELAFKPYVSALIEREEIGKAEAILHLALQGDYIAENRTWGWHTLAQLQQEQGKWEDALATFSSGLQEFKSDATLMVGLGWLLYEQEQDGEAARAQFEAAIAAEPDAGVGYFAVAELAAKQSDYSTADKWFASALGKEDSNPRWRLVRANTARRAGNYDLAVDQYSAIIEHNPAYAPPYYELAETYRLLGASGQAVQVLDRAAQIPSVAPIRYYLLAAEIYLWGEQPERAVRMYEKVLDLDPGHRRAIELLDQLQKQ